MSKFKVGDVVVEKNCPWLPTKVLGVKSTSGSFGYGEIYELEGWPYRAFEAHELDLYDKDKEKKFWDDQFKSVIDKLKSDLAEK